jgi:actin-related protein
VLCGGATFAPGFAERVQTEVLRWISTRLPPSSGEPPPLPEGPPSPPPRRALVSPLTGALTPSAPPTPQVISSHRLLWVGSELVAEVFEANWVTKQDYDDFGPKIIHQCDSMPKPSYHRTKVPVLVVAPTKTRAIAPPERKYSVWLGGSIFATHGQPEWIELNSAQRLAEKAAVAEAKKSLSESGKRTGKKTRKRTGKLTSRSV